MNKISDKLLERFPLSNGNIDGSPVPSGFLNDSYSCRKEMPKPCL